MSGLLFPLVKIDWLGGLVSDFDNWVAFVRGGCSFDMPSHITNKVVDTLVNSYFLHTVSAENTKTNNELLYVFTIKLSDTLPFNYT